MPINYTIASLTYEDDTVVPDHRYNYKVYAVNGATGGERYYSNEINVGIGGLPDAPTVFPLTTNDVMIRIGWSKPTNPALQVTGYRVYVFGELTWDGAGQPDIFEFTLENCTRGEPYDFKVTALNSFGEVLNPTILTRYCARRPYKPPKPWVIEISCARNPGILDRNSITIEYSEPEDNGGRSLKGWWVQRAQGDSLVFIGVGPLFPMTEDTTIFKDVNDVDGYGPIGLVFGEIYKYRVVATNLQDDYNFDSATDYITVECAMPTTLAPSYLARLPATSRTEIGVTWPFVEVTEETDPNGAAPTGYLLYAGNGTDGAMTLLYNGTDLPDTNVFVHTNLAPGQSVRYRVACTVAFAGTDPVQWSPLTTFWAAESPSAPQAPFLMLAQSSTLMIGWSLPADDGASPISGYYVKHDGGDPSKTELDTTIAIYSPNVLEVELTGLQAGQPVRVEVFAANTIGNGSSATATYKTLTTIPAIPLAQTLLSLEGDAGAQQNAAAASVGTLGCEVYAGKQGDGIVTRVTGLLLGTRCGDTSNEPIASILAGSSSRETVFTATGHRSQSSCRAAIPYRRGAACSAKFHLGNTGRSTICPLEMELTTRAGIHLAAASQIRCAEGCWCGKSPRPLLGGADYLALQYH
jgi:hypothetical protein